MNSYRAELIGETSAGLTAIQIYVNNTLYWSTNFFENGSTRANYKQGLRRAYDTAMNCDTVVNWSELENDPVDYLVDDTCYVVATYTPNDGWEISDPATHDGQSVDFFIENDDRLPLSDVLAWTADNYDYDPIPLIKKLAWRALDNMPDDEIMECVEQCKNQRFMNCIITIDSEGTFRTDSDLHSLADDCITISNDPSEFMYQLGYTFNSDTDEFELTDPDEPFNSSDVRYHIQHCYLGD